MPTDRTPPPASVTRELPAHEDARGAIQPLLEDVPFRSVLRITSKRGSVRANHYHRLDYHYCYLESGRIEYFERPAGSVEPPSRTVIEAGQLFYTGPMVEHAMRFLDDSVFWVFSRNSRKQSEYESDTVRVRLIDEP